MGQWMETIVKESKQIGDTDKSITVKLPRANRIGEVSFMLSGNGGSGTPALEELISNISIVADSQTNIIDVNAQQMRDIAQVRNKGIRAEIVETTGGDCRIMVTMLMGRFKHDPEMILPAYLYSSLDLKISFNTLIGNDAFTTGSVSLDVFCDECIVGSGDISDSDLILQKIAQVTAFNTIETGVRDVELHRGHYIGAVYVRAEGVDGATIPKYAVSLNNGAKTPVTKTWLKSQSDDMQEYGIVGLLGAAKLANVTMVDFDNPATAQIMEEVIDTTPKSGVQSVDLKLTVGVLSKAISVVQITYIPYAAL